MYHKTLDDWVGESLQWQAQAPLHTDAQALRLARDVHMISHYCSSDCFPAFTSVHCLNTRLAPVSGADSDCCGSMLGLQATVWIRQCTAGIWTKPITVWTCGRYLFRWGRHKDGRQLIQERA